MKKKGQEEMIGFVVILVLVVVIGLILLVISLRNMGDSQVRESEEINSFLFSIRPYTTSCVSRGYPQTIREVVADCSDGKLCDNGKSACEVLETTIKDILDSSTFVVSQDSENIYYKLNIYKESANQQSNVIEPVEKFRDNVRDCRGVKLYNYQVISTRAFENIYVSLEVCKELSD